MKNLIVLDGGMGRELKTMGAPFSQPLWSAQALIESPIHVGLAHDRFINAGAEIIITNAYACVPFHLDSTPYQNDGAKLARIAAKIARNSVDKSGKPVKVAGAIPPAFGSYRPDLFRTKEAKRIFADLYNAQAPFVDLWIAETIASLEELSVIHSVLKEAKCPCHYSFTLSDCNEGPSTLRSGESVFQATQSVIDAGGEAFYLTAQHQK